MTNVLIIDDDAELVELFQDYLQQEQFFVDASLTGKQGLEMAQSGKYDLVILDMMLPDMTGTDILLKIRQISSIPVLMFTAKGDDIDRIIGLESGADDYVPKPCNPRELVARIRAILRRVETTVMNQHEQDFTVGPLTLSSQKRQAIWFEQLLDLTSTEFNLLEALARKAGQVVTKDELSQQAMGRPLVRYDRSIDVHMSSIRQKLSQQDDGFSYIQTIRGKGYQFIRD